MIFQYPFFFFIQLSDEDEAEHCFEEDDEERTLSTDTYLNELDANQLLDGSQNETVASVETSSPSTLNCPGGGAKRANPMILNLAQKFDKIVQNNNNQSPHPEPALQLAKKKSSSHISLIQKQISLYEREPTVEKVRPIRQRSYRSVERMDSMTMSVADPLADAGQTTKPSLPVPSKTKSCVNLKNYYSTTKDHSMATTSTDSSKPSHAGALIVKENFIELPKRVTKSFHGRTDLLKQNAVNLRFRTTVVKESGSEEKTGEAKKEQDL